MTQEEIDMCIEALKIAKDHWHTYHDGAESPRINNAIKVLEEALTKQSDSVEQCEPVALKSNINE